MDDGSFWVSKGYKLLSGPDNESKIYYRLVGETLKTHIILRLPKGGKLMVQVEKADKWLVSRLKELGEL